MTPRLLAVTDPGFDDAHLIDVVARAAAVFAKGAFGVQLRDKQRPREAVAALAARLRDVTSAHGARLVINGDVALASLVRADGVHLGSAAWRREGAVARARDALGAEAAVSVAAHSLDDVSRALREGARGALVSPIHDVPGKGPARGLGALREARVVVGTGFALHALGGVTPARAADCLAAGADGVAVMRALFAAPDATAVARAFAEALGAAAP